MYRSPSKHGKIFEKIASYSRPKDSALYNGYCFKCSASFAADSGINSTTIKRQEGWKYSGIAESYLEDSIENNKTDF